MRSDRFSGRLARHADEALKRTKRVASTRGENAGCSSVDIYVSNDRRHRSRHVRAYHGSEVERTEAANIGGEAYHDVNGTPVYARSILEELKSYGR